jgi:hypothetical protein
MLAVDRIMFVKKRKVEIGHPIGYFAMFLLPSPIYAPVQMCPFSGPMPVTFLLAHTTSPWVPCRPIFE